MNLSVLFWIAFFLGNSILSLLLLARISGWHRLAQRYRTYQPPPPGTSYMNSGYVGLSRFRNMLMVGVDNQGLYLATFPPFSWTLPPIFIPWREVIQVERKQTLFVSYYCLRINTIPVTVVKLRPGKLSTVEAILNRKM